MPFVLSLACTHLKMSPAEAIAAATVNGAWALRLQKRKGSIEPGKDADLAVFDVEDYREIAFWVASNRCAFPVLNGVVATSKPPQVSVGGRRRQLEWTGSGNHRQLTTED
jgi:imidazolonepropionase-like amidohydrolase